MIQIRSVVALILIFGATDWSVHALYCEQPRPVCTFMYEDKCPPTTEATCNATGGTFLDGADAACNISCGLCVHYVGAQERCNLTLTTNEGDYKTVLCEPPLVCTMVSNGICVARENCTYTSDAQHVHRSIPIWTFIISLVFTTCWWF